MAITPHIHLRSISLPSRLHPINNLENELQKLKSYQASSHSFASPEATESMILGLIQLYDSFQELVKSPSTQQSFVHQDEKSIEESLDRSVQILDTCSQTRDLLMSIKENVQALQSSMRRKGREYCIDDIAAYFSFRKKMNKYIAKTIKNMVKTSTHCSSSSSSRSNNLSSLTNGDGDFTTLLKEVSGIATDVLKTVLVFTSCPKAKSSRWPLVSKMILAKSLAFKRGDHHHVDVNEVENTDFAILSLQEKIRLNVAEINDVQTVQKRLESFETSIERLECGLESLFRQLVQCRVILLNVLADH